MMQRIEQLDAQKFKVWWDEQPDQVLSMDFGVFAPWTRGIYCLLHWQAKPKGLRRWGVYDSATDSYIGVDWCNLQLDATKFQPLQVDERVILTVPTAVLYLPGARVLEQSPVRIGRA